MAIYISLPCNQISVIGLNNTRIITMVLHLKFKLLSYINLTTSLVAKDTAMLRSY